jgi:hypothetical protein
VPDHRKADIGTDPYRDHVLGNLLAKPYARVEALLDDVRQGLIKGELNLDVRIVGKKRSELRPKNRLGDMVARRDPDRAGGLLTELAQSV